MSGRGVAAAPIAPIRPVSGAYLAKFTPEERKARSSISTGCHRGENQPVTANRAALPAPCGVATGPNVPRVDIWPGGAAAAPIGRRLSAAYLARFSCRERWARFEGIPGARISGNQPVTANRSCDSRLNRGPFSPNDPWMKLWPSGRPCGTNRPETAGVAFGTGPASVGIAASGTGPASVGIPV
jgi:hypothetical protein